jgi:hypothetical protein
MNLAEMREILDGKKKYSSVCMSKDKCSFHAVLPIRMALLWRGSLNGNDVSKCRRIGKRVIFDGFAKSRKS